MKNVKEKRMEVKILQGVTPFEIELRVNEFLARTPYQVVDIKFCSMASAGASAAGKPRHRLVTSSASGAWSRPEEHWKQLRHTTELSWITILRGRFAPMQKG